MGLNGYTVTDNGVGFDTQDAAGFGMGLNSMRSRVEGLGGELEISSRPGETCIRARVTCRRRTAQSVALLDQDKKPGLA